MTARVCGLSRAFPAANPVFQIEETENKRAEGFYDKMGTLGAHEIIVEARSHAKTFSTFETAEVSRVVDMYSERILDLKKDKRFKYIQVYKNHGENTGSRISHPHSHVLATPIVPHQLSLELANSKYHYLQKERCLLCDEVSQENRADQASHPSERATNSWLSAPSPPAWISRPGLSPYATIPFSSRGGPMSTEAQVSRRLHERHEAHRKNKIPIR